MENNIGKDNMEIGNGGNDMSKVAVFFGTGFEEIEALTVVDILRRADIETDMVSVMGEKSVTGSHKIAVEMDKLLEEVNFDQVDVIVLPGGLAGTKNLEACEPLMEQVDRFVSAGKTVAAICAAPRVFAGLGLLNGKKATCYPSVMEELTGAVKSEDAVVVDGNITTSRGLGTAIDFSLELIAQLISREKADEIAESVVYKR